MKKEKIKTLPKTKLGALIIDKFNKDKTKINYQIVGIDRDPWCQWDKDYRSWWIIASKSHESFGSFQLWCTRNKGMGNEKEINYTKLKDTEKLAIQKYFENAKLHKKETHFEKSKSFPTAKPWDYTALWFTSTEEFPDLEEYLPESWHQPNPDWSKTK